MFSWFSNVFGKPPAPALDKMQLGPEGATHNPLMVFFFSFSCRSKPIYVQIQFFTWDALHDSLSWWKHVEAEIPRLAELGVTQIWLPPPNKAAEPVCSEYYLYFDNVNSAVAWSRLRRV